MAERQSQKFPHIQLRLTRAGGVASAGFPREDSRTSANRGDRQGHGKKLQGEVFSMVSEWQDIDEKREEEEKPKLPDNSRRLILQIDPTTVDPDKLKSYGIELIAELENGYIIGASVDLELSDLQKKIDKFIEEEKRSGGVAGIWEIIDGIKKPELILSPELWNNWEQVKDNQIYTVDVGIACVGTESKLPDYPKRKDDESDDKYNKRLKTWIDKRDMTYESWDDVQSQRQDELKKFVSFYNGNREIQSFIEGKIVAGALLPDSFSCRISISGKGLKDLVLNFPYIFDVSEPDEFSEFLQKEGLSETDEPSFVLEAPELNAPKVCVIDSGIQERHPLLRAAIDSQNSRSWVPGETDQTADYVKNGGHGTRVAGAILYPRTIPRNGTQKAICWIQNARVLDRDCYLPQTLFPPNLLSEIVDIYYQTGTRIFNHSIAGVVPCRLMYMSPWAAAIDQLTWHNDILVIVSAGNLDKRIGNQRLSVRDHLKANRPYPDYLLEDSCRIANPAQSFQALTVGSIALTFYNSPPQSSISKTDMPSAFSCSGLGIWETIKPEVVEYGGDLVKDESTPPSLTCPEAVCPELVRSTLGGGPAISSDQVGTSYATPKVSHIAACLASELPNESCLLYRALIVQSARWPEWAFADNIDQGDVIRQIGYGIPRLDRALGNAPNRITLITTGEQRIKARYAHVYQVKLPEQLLSQGEELEILVEITLSYKAQPRRTRRNRRRYLSTWLDWECSKKGEEPDRFLARILKDYDASEDSERGEDPFKWTLGKRNNYGQVREVSRSAGTIQKDWVIVNSYNLREAFCIAVVGHEGWNNDPEASVPYSLVVSFEAIQANVPIYNVIVQAQVETRVEQQVNS
ncbi:subtilase family protein [Lyngbya aestuarii BL J]|uniref:Subtilase family protein n=1 Tax=Lyngbya aestuarii BL J TaxID=1348334 RepID=U7QI28_9CYAN|nr:S8 family peptidase [Lyngbya aestuarii]ERT06081.1 subtilase family protein [Lyngbya aestuarii BL J]